MKTYFEREAAEHPGTVPVSALAELAWDGPETVRDSIAAVYLAEQDRLLKAAYRRVHKTDGADPENIVAEALVRVLEAAETVKGVEHCRTLLRKAVFQLSLNAIRDSHTVELTDTNAPRTKAETTKGQDTSMAWILDLCADTTEQRILAIWMLPGHETAQAVAEATKHWVERWTAKDVLSLFARLRHRMGVRMASLRSVQFTTKGTLPGLHCERFSSLGCVLLMEGAGRWSGPRKPTYEETAAARHVVPATRWDAVAGVWVSGTEVVCSTR